MAINISLFDLRFLLSRVNTSWMSEEFDGLAPFGPTGIRNVQGLGNNTTDQAAPGYWFGAGDTLFPRLTFNRLTSALTKNDIISSPFANSIRGVNQKITIGYTTTIGGILKDALNPRNISNLIADSSSPVGFSSLNTADVNYARKLALKLQDNPTGRISPISGAINPLPFSNWMSQFGQFFDHGLDFVAKGVDGKVDVSLLPSDSLFSRSTTKAITASRNNTANITFGAGTSDALLTKMGVSLDKQDVNSWDVMSTITTPGIPPSAGFAYEGTLVLNDTLIKIQASDAFDLAAQISFYAPTTGVLATAQPFPEIPGLIAAGSFQLILTPARAESFNQVSPFIDLSQNYGSDTSRTVFLREYLTTTAWKSANLNTTVNPTVTDLTTGRLLNAGVTVNGEADAGMANWALVKANALALGITLHDVDIKAIPLIAFNESGQMILDASGLPQLVALNKITGEQVYVKNSYLAADAVITELVAGSGGTLSATNFVLMTTKHAFLNDMAPFALAPAVSANGIPALTASGDNPAGYDAAMATFFTANNFGTFQPLNAHYVSGDGRLNENIGLTAVHEVFLTEHNRVLTELKTKYGLVGEQPAGGWNWTDPLTAESSIITGEDLFQMAKLVVEMEYQHMVFAEFARKLSPNIAGFAGVNPLIDARISSEFANAVYRLGHSMLPEAVGMRQVTDATRLSTTSGSNVIQVSMANHGLKTGAQVTLAGVNTAIGGVAATRLNGTFSITSTVIPGPCPAPLVTPDSNT